METIQAKYKAAHPLQRVLLVTAIVLACNASLEEARGWIAEPHKAPPACVDIFKKFFPENFTEPEKEAE